MAKEIKSKSANCVVYTDGTILVKGLRGSYPHLDKPYKGDNGGEGGPKYSIVGLSPKDRKDVVQACVKAIDALLAEKNDGKKIPSDKKFMRDGDQTGKEGYEGCYTINASESENNPPILRDERNKTVTPDKALRKFYAGCVVNILIKPWFQNNKFGKRVNASLLAVQFMEDGEPLGTERISEEDVDGAFEDHGGDDDNGFDDADGL